MLFGLPFFLVSTVSSAVFLFSVLGLLQMLVQSMSRVLQVLLLFFLMPLAQVSVPLSVLSQPSPCDSVLYLQFFILLFFLVLALLALGVLLELVRELLQQVSLLVAMCLVHFADDLRLSALLQGSRCFVGDLFLVLLRRSGLLVWLQLCWCALLELFVGSR